MYELLIRFLIIGCAVGGGVGIAMYLAYKFTQK
jgi:hypothetical protein